MSITRVIKNKGGGGVIDSVVIDDDLFAVDGYIVFSAPALSNRNHVSVFGFLRMFLKYNVSGTEAGEFAGIELDGMALDPRIAGIDNIKLMNGENGREYGDKCPHVLYFSGSAETAMKLIEASAPYISGRMDSAYDPGFLIGKTSDELVPGRWEDIMDPEILKKNFTVIQPPPLSSGSRFQAHEL